MPFLNSVFPFLVDPGGGGGDNLSGKPLKKFNMASQQPAGGGLGFPDLSFLFGLGGNNSTLANTLLTLQLLRGGGLTNLLGDNQSSLFSNISTGE